MLAFTSCELLLIPEDAMRVMVQVRRKKVESELDALNSPGAALVRAEFIDLASTAYEELVTGYKLNEYIMRFSDVQFNSSFNDRKLYEFLGLMYLSRLFESQENRSAFFCNMEGNVSRIDLREIAAEGSLQKLSTRKMSSRVRLKVKTILESEHFTHMPGKHLKENEDLSPVLKRLRMRISALKAVGDDQMLMDHFQELENQIVNLYKATDWSARRDLSESETCRRETAFGFTSEDAQRLLAAARSNVFFFDLISKKPPRCGYISHEQALLECAEHARLWLINSKLPVYYNFKLRYCDVAKGDALSSVELEAWRSPVGYEAKLLSAIEKELRRTTLALYWENGAATINLVPEDFANVQTDKPEELGILKFLGTPTTLEHKDFNVWESANRSLRALERDDPCDKIDALKKMAKEISSRSQKRRRFKHKVAKGPALFPRCRFVSK